MDEGATIGRDGMGGAMSASVPVFAQAGDDDGSNLMIMAPVTGAAVDGQADKVNYRLTNEGRQITRICILMRGNKDFGGPFTSRPTGIDPIKVVAATHDHKTAVAEASVKMEVR
ncbi:MAG: hypothetical protein KGS09_07075 [Nitrospirae bacterium]|nr:hypothetical protein [Nitrospirota bacterium]